MSEQDAAAAAERGAPGITVPVDVDFLPELIEVHGLALYPLDRQRIQDKVQVGANVVGVVVDGLDDYLATCKRGEFEIPGAYSRWDDEYGHLDLGDHDPTRVCAGPIGQNEDDADEYVQACFASDLARAGVRIVTGGGRYSADDLTFHSAVPFSVLEGNGHAVAIAPLFRELDPSEVDGEPDFSYESAHGRVTEIHP